MSDAVNEALDETIITLEFALKDVNILLNALNLPAGTATVVLASFIQAIQMQSMPQVEKARTALEAVLGKKDEPKAAA
jgi:hypothetical protein